MPQWLKQAISAGQSLDHFAIDGTASPAASAMHRKIDWREDPFSGTRLQRFTLHMGMPADA
ncbi:hypothetical protein [Paraburkholderia phymatum]|uniref:hypothetical protein n=1 Tax=Paraburkholderia phymatum TaxID=148447 RepID=UPI003D1785BA